MSLGGLDVTRRKILSASLRLAACQTVDDDRLLQREGPHMGTLLILP